MIYFLHNKNVFYLINHRKSIFDKDLILDKTDTLTNFFGST